MFRKEKDGYVVYEEEVVMEEDEEGYDDDRRREDVEDEEGEEAEDVNEEAEYIAEGRQEHHQHHLQLQQQQQDDEDDEDDDDVWIRPSRTDEYMPKPQEPEGSEPPNTYSYLPKEITTVNLKTQHSNGSTASSTSSSKERKQESSTANIPKEILQQIIAEEHKVLVKRSTSNHRRKLSTVLEEVDEFSHTHTDDRSVGNSKHRRVKLEEPAEFDEMFSDLARLQLDEPLEDTVHRKLVLWAEQKCTRSKLELLGVFFLTLDFLGRMFEDATATSQACKLLLPLVVQVRNESSDNSTVIAAQGGIAILIEAMNHHKTNALIQRDGLVLLCNLAYSTYKFKESSNSPILEYALVQAKAIEVPFMCLDMHIANATLVARCIHTLWHFSMCGARLKKGILKLGGVKKTIQSLNFYPENKKVMENATGLMKHWIMSSTDNLLPWKDAERMIQALVSIMEKVPDNSDMQGRVCDTICAICEHNNDTRKAVLEAGGLTAISSLAESKDLDYKIKAKAFRGIQAMVAPEIPEENEEA